MSEILTPWDHQIEADRLAEVSEKIIPGFGYHMEMGTGKTPTAILTLRRLMNEQKRLMKILVFTPPMVIPQWKEEFKRFSKIDQNSITLLMGKGEKRLMLFKQRGHDAQGNPKPHVFVTNYETLTMGGKHGEKRGSPYQQGPLLRAFTHWKPDAIIWDEAHSLKSPEAIRSKEAYHLSNPFDLEKRAWARKPYTYNLTGSPILNSALDIFQQFKVMLGGWPTRQFMESMGDKRYLITNFYAFRARYFRDKNAGMPSHDRTKYEDWQPMTLEKDGIDALAEIEATIARFSYRKMKSECLQLPPELIVPMRVPMSTEQAKAYKELKEQLITYVDDRACKASLAVVKALRLMQITSGFISLEGQGDEMDRANKRFDDTPKIEALRYLLEEITPHSKMIVWACWRENYQALRNLFEELKIDFVECHGDVSSETKKRANVERFKKDEKARVFLGHPLSGGIGLNLVAAPYSAFYSWNFSLLQWLQAKSRNHRGGAEVHEKITHYVLPCQDTIDEYVFEKLEEKREIGEKLLGDLAKRLAVQSARE